MYNLKLNKKENITLISDNTIIYNNDEQKVYTCIITNNRFLILDYPNKFHNSQEDLRLAGRINYIPMKEIIFSTPLKEIISITKENDKYKITFNNNTFIYLNDKDIIEYLKNKDTNL